MVLLVFPLFLFFFFFFTFGLLVEGSVYNELVECPLDLN